ncbi:MAG: hypothetical protein LBS30_03980 [Planctomycetota bacterium]|jgi:hypothetical protein|nr:hypothetical protein [Planctomycetota bacterium]
MASKKEFHFDFNENADPVDELHRLRAAKTKHFKTMDAYMRYLRETPSVQEMIAEVDAEIAAKKKAPAAASRKANVAPKSAGRRKTGKRLTHA